jgi:hypothetical protein
MAHDRTLFLKYIWKCTFKKQNRTKGIYPYNDTFDYIFINLGIVKLIGNALCPTRGFALLGLTEVVVQQLQDH